MSEQVQVVVQTPGASQVVSTGSGGLATQLPGQATTVDGIGGGVGDGLDHLSQVDIDAGIVRFKSNRTPLMTLMMKSKLRLVPETQLPFFELLFVVQ